MPTIDGFPLFWASAERGQAIPPAQARAMNSRRLMGTTNLPTMTLEIRDIRLRNLSTRAAARATNQRDELAPPLAQDKASYRLKRVTLIGAETGFEQRPAGARRSPLWVFLARNRQSRNPFHGRMALKADAIFNRLRPRSGKRSIRKKLQGAAEPDRRRPSPCCRRLFGGPPVRKKLFPNKLEPDRTRGESADEQYPR
jgi:hypothetical protein